MDRVLAQLGRAWMAARPRLLDTLWGRVVFIAVLTKAAIGVMGLLVTPPFLLALLDDLATIALIVVAIYGLVRLAGVVKRRLLWRVRRKLILSYVLIGVVPVVLIALFFVGAGALTFLNLSSYLIKSGLEDLTAQTRMLASDLALAVVGAADRQTAELLLERHQADVASRLGDVSITLVPLDTPIGPDVAPAQAGPWWHVEPPSTVPRWISRAGFGGLLAYAVPDTEETALVIRAVAFPDQRAPAAAVIVDVPIDDEVAGRLRDEIGVELRDVRVIPIGGQAVPPEIGRIGRDEPAGVDQPAGSQATFTASWITFTDHIEWETGRTGTVGLSTEVGVTDLWGRISQSETRVGEMNLGDLFIAILSLIGGLFLVIELIALVTGLLLARSITGSVHELFVGTERVRAGDFTHRIRMRSDDQLGQLGTSFNEMTASVERLLLEADEKKRLEQELQIAREVQMSLLPDRPLQMPGLTMTTACEPAREVGGDYYDFFQLSDRRVGLLIADVSGKGTSAAFYMAELKGLLLAMSRIHDSPRDLLIALNGVLSNTLDNRTFITMTYAILDLDARTLTYARAGHTPLIHMAAATAGAREVQVHTPDGMVVGLCLEGIEQKFSEVLEERTLSIGPGDIIVLYTDGISEAMNGDSDLFGEDRLSRVLERHADLPSDELRERILGEVRSFVGAADQHDDMTMVLIKITELDAPGLEEPGPRAIAV